MTAHRKRRALHFHSSGHESQATLQLSQGLTRSHIVWIQCDWFNSNRHKVINRIEVRKIKVTWKYQDIKQLLISPLEAIDVIQIWVAKVMVSKSTTPSRNIVLRINFVIVVGCVAVMGKSKKSLLKSAVIVGLEATSRALYLCFGVGSSA